MGNLTSYGNGNKVVNVNNLFDIDGTPLFIKELFTINEEIYVSYIINDELIIELADKFIDDKQEYFDSVTLLITTKSGDCGCGCNEN